MKKIILIPTLLCVLFLFFAGNFRSTTTSSTAETINTGATSLYHFNAMNTSSVTVFFFLYDASSVPSYTATPIMSLQCEANKQIWWEDLAFKSTPFVYNFNNGCYIRTILSAVSTNTVAPASGSVIFEANY